MRMDTWPRLVHSATVNLRMELPLLSPPARKVFRSGGDHGVTARSGGML